MFSLQVYQLGQRIGQSLIDVRPVADRGLPSTIFNIDCAEIQLELLQCLSVTHDKVLHRRGRDDAPLTNRAIFPNDIQERERSKSRVSC